MSKRIAPYGSWASPITAEWITAGSVGLGWPQIDGEDIYWVEMRPSEGGRSVVVRREPDGSTRELLPSPYNARSRVHEYGGTPYFADKGVVTFVNFTDQRLYRALGDREPEPITPAGPVRYADFAVDPIRDRFVCVREDHSDPTYEPTNAIVSIPREGGTTGRIIASGHDFFAGPRVSPDGSQMAWIAWDHPNMPWDGSELWVGAFDREGVPTGPVRIAGGPEESIFQAEWSPDGLLTFVSDRTGWWNLYRVRNGRIEPLLPMEAEFGLPLWSLGASTYSYESAERLICCRYADGIGRLGALDTRRLDFRDIETPFLELQSPHALPGSVVFVGGAPDRPSAIVRTDLETGKTEELRSSVPERPDSGYLSVPRSVRFPGEGGEEAHAFVYLPVNRDFSAPEGEKPPLVVMSHGGPTGAATLSMKIQIHYWTSRGIAVADVNYGGSTGFGRSYRKRLDGRWGIVDVGDCAGIALHLAREGLVDGDRMAIRGGSAGGYTTLAALAFRDVFRAGASHYGVSDLEALAVETHKYESRYLDRLIGPYPERRDLYIERSPLYHADRISCPVIFFQGMEDRVVPPNQAEKMVERMMEKGIPVAYVPFEGEQHGFRKAESIRRALEAELSFYGIVFHFDPADPVDPISLTGHA